MIKKTLLKTTSLMTLAIAISAFIPASANAAWKQNSTGWWYTEGSSYATGWRYIGGTWYFFDANGYMKTGWIKDGGSWYYMNSSGAMQTGWIIDNGWWYFLNNSGVMQTGWTYTGGTWYFMNYNGVMIGGWLYDGSDYYYLGHDGAMRTDSWISDDFTSYYVGPSGAMETGSISDKVNLTYTFEDCESLIRKEDSNFIKSFENKHGINNANFISKIARSSSYVGGNSDDKVFYEVYMLSPNDKNMSDIQIYFVGATTGTIYRRGHHDSLALMEIKDNSIVQIGWG